MKSVIESHFDKIWESLILLFIFTFATVMLAYFKNEEMARWIENGAVITILARAFGSRGTAANTTTTTSSTTTPEILIAEKPKEN